MTLETSRIDQAHGYLVTVVKVQEVFREALLGALSEARQLTLTVEPKFRDQLMDDLSKQFHPDGYARDLFSEAFHNVNEMLTEEIDGLKDELAIANRQAGIRHAAE